MEGKIRVGCIADDFTGASDAASFLRRQGMKTVLFNGLPEEKLPENCDAIVVALKSRTAPVKEAVNDSIQALKWMKAQGAAQLYINTVLPLIPQKKEIRTDSGCSAGNI